MVKFAECPCPEAEEDWEKVDEQEDGRKFTITYRCHTCDELAVTVGEYERV